MNRRKTNRQLLAEILLEVRITRLEQLEIAKALVPNSQKAKIARLIKGIRDNIKAEFNANLNDKY